ncbi:MAG: phosphoribosylaminoimidazolesuccinocarboxamide synthase [Candidatus Omnitrophota bacterium]|nr:phosphoribosylaminoimidazolesuccinocarboxamide synthase [Candidatus Omnitrophota bacterium]MBU1895038.1 phosphoribosylaminoimidazolesuccinocarboxamide synthase [Candidatus Omnitrophota bacterium]
MHTVKPLLSLDLKGIPLLKQGKVRNVYDLNDKLLFVATDRISAFDVIMPRGIPEKGKVLNMISVFWFEYTKDLVENHMVTSDIDKIVSQYPILDEYKGILAERSMLVKKAEPILAECVVRGYISGSGWKDYQKTGSICGIKLPAGLKESEKFEEPLFTPSTKADEGHDMNVSEEEIKKTVGADVLKVLKEKSLALYKKASWYAESRGIIIADTKFEFGIVNGKIILMDEALTPDSSRFWPKNDYTAGRAQKSFDKQFVRDYLETLDWDKTPPGPELPEDIVIKTSEKYLDAYKILTGKELVG